MAKSVAWIILACEDIFLNQYAVQSKSFLGKVDPSQKSIRDQHFLRKINYSFTIRRLIPVTRFLSALYPNSSASIINNVVILISEKYWCKSITSNNLTYRFFRLHICNYVTLDNFYNKFKNIGIINSKISKISHYGKIYEV